jgi:ribosomal protein S12 methylthiotransferase accessory factor YcaO
VEKRRGPSGCKRMFDCIRSSGPRATTGVTSSFGNEPRSELAWHRALEAQQHRRSAATVEEDPFELEEPSQPQRKRLRSVVVVE